MLVTSASFAWPGQRFSVYIYVSQSLGDISQSQLLIGCGSYGNESTWSAPDGQRKANEDIVRPILREGLGPGDYYRA